MHEADMSSVDHYAKIPACSCSTVLCHIPGQDNITGTTYKGSSLLTRLGPLHTQDETIVAPAIELVDCLLSILPAHNAAHNQRRVQRLNKQGRNPRLQITTILTASSMHWLRHEHSFSGQAPVHKVDEGKATILASVSVVCHIYPGDGTKGREELLYTPHNEVNLLQCSCRLQVACQPIARIADAAQLYMQDQPEAALPHAC